MYTKDFEMALESLKLYSCLIVDKNNELSNIMTKRLSTRRHFTPHCQTVIQVIQDYYGTNGFLEDYPDFCTLSVLKQRLDNAFAKITINHAATKLKKIIELIEYMVLNEQLDNLFSICKPKTLLPQRELVSMFDDIEKANTLIQNIHRVCALPEPAMPLTASSLIEAKIKLHLRLHQSIDFDHEVTTLQYFAVFNNAPQLQQNLKFFDYKPALKQYDFNLDFAKCCR